MNDLGSSHHTSETPEGTFAGPAETCGSKSQSLGLPYSAKNSCVNVQAWALKPGEGAFPDISMGGEKAGKPSLPLPLGLLCTLERGKTGALLIQFRGSLMELEFSVSVIQRNWLQNKNCWQTIAPLSVSAFARLFTIKNQKEVKT